LATLFVGTAGPAGGGGGGGGGDGIIGPPDIFTSFMIVSPTASILADGVAPAAVTVTVRDADGDLVPGRAVALRVIAGTSVTIAPASATTDATGRARFTVRTTRAGTVRIAAAIDPGAAPEA